ncbi:ATP-binding protein [Paenibacillus naphthalenovorans]|uniref:ATP-binding protein n=1 Tax=Paenibacillus naphthalenovorans TaxID=162209 RepID=UPI0008815C9D|nr:DUF87 domain-containing protein [Paenibacillus naphthalenovorans]SDJ96090.1 hypothetical protein SAMN05421868_1654 [Paenibacillus naphthalenovorans]
MRYIVGKVVGIEDGMITVSLYNHYIDDEGNSVGVPESMKVTITTDEGPFPMLIGQPGSFLEIQLPSGSMLGVVTGIKMQETPILENKPSSGVPLIEVKRLLSVIPVGKFNSQHQFERGSDVFPTVNSEVYAVLPETISEVYRSFTEGDFSIGNLSILPEQRAFINLDTFLGRHTALLGQTGGGKSWTVASILQKISSLPNSTMLLLDLHGEYNGAFGNDVEYISANDIELPYWLMNFEELMGLCVDRAENSAPNQIAKFRELLQKEKERSVLEEGLDLPKVTVDTPVFFSFENLISELTALDTQIVPGANNRYDLCSSCH